MRYAHEHPRLRARLAALLVTAVALSTVAVPTAAAAACYPEIVGPTSVYIVAGQPVSEHRYTTGCDEPTTWSVSGDLPSGISFDPAAQRFIGTPTSTDGGFQIATTSESGDSLIEGSFEPLNTAVTLTSASDALAPGDPYELNGDVIHIAAQVAVEVFWDGTSQQQTSVAPETGYSFELTVPTTASRGTHHVTTVFELRNGQSYTTTNTVVVSVLELSGPDAIYASTGVDASYTYTSVGGSGVITLHGELPAGMTFDPDTATISGAPEAATTNHVVTIELRDGDRTHSLEIPITVVEASALQFPNFNTAQQLSNALGQIGAIGGTMTQSELDELLKKQAAEKGQKPPTLPIGPDPQTGGETITVGSEHEWKKEQARKLEELAKRLADEAQKSREQKEKEHDELKRELDRLIQERKDAAEQEEQKRKEELDRIIEAKKKAAEEAAKRAKEQADKQREMDNARDALADRLAQLLLGSESKPLPPGTVVRLELHSTPVLLGQATVGASGGYLIRASVPTGTPPGAHNLVISYTLPNGVVHTQSTAVTVVAAAIGDSRLLPPTGAATAPLGYLAGVLMLIGAMLVVRARRKVGAGTTAQLEAAAAFRSWRRSFAPSTRK